MKNKRLISIVAPLLLVFGLGTMATASIPQGGAWTNFGSGYANSRGTYGMALVNLTSVSPYAPDDVQAVVDDNGGNDAVFIQWTGQCWNSANQLDTVTGSTTVDPGALGYVIGFNVAPTHIRCKLSVSAQFTQQAVGERHLDVSLQSINF